jgi:hypothetical protein
LIKKDIREDASEYPDESWKGNVSGWQDGSVPLWSAILSALSSA